MKLMKRPLEATLATLPIMSEWPSKSHPARAARIAGLEGRLGAPGDR
jgi:hypothetical protein